MAAGNTYVAIAEQTLGSAAATVTFSSISGAYTDLVFILNVKGSVAGVDDDVTARFNSDTGSNYSWTRIYGDGTTAGSQQATAQTVLRVGNQSGTGSSAFSPMILNIMNYANTTTYKTMIARPNNPARVVDAYVNLWRSTSAITTVSFACGGNFIAGSTFSLYGIAAA
jgi:hypothetical protein